MFVVVQQQLFAFASTYFPFHSFHSELQNNSQVICCIFTTHEFGSPFLPKLLSKFKTNLLIICKSTHQKTQEQCRVFTAFVNNCISLVADHVIPQEEFNEL